MHQQHDEDEQVIGASQAKLRDAIEENGRLITENQRLIDRYRQRWDRQRAESPAQAECASQTMTLSPLGEEGA